ncbi:MAG: hypothetical protein QOI15_2547 [Pseudonocardiales bacterium]|jgi:hypothetical protein|nr:hypothetical protein [Pseudonocardiales bacterium]
MRWLNWRRAAALLAIVAGVAVGATAPASAATHSHHADTVSTQDIWW